MTAALPALLPTAKDVRDLLESLFGKDVIVAPGAPVSLNDKPAVAVYVDPTMATTALCLLDIRLAAWFAGALALLPKGGLEDASTRASSPRAPRGRLRGGEHRRVDVQRRGRSTTPSCTSCTRRGSRAGRHRRPGRGVQPDRPGVDVAGYGSGELSIVMAH